MEQRVVIVDDHAAFRGELRALLEEEGYRVVGEAADGSSAIDIVLDLSPNVVVLDIQLPDIDGFEVAERLAEGAPQADIVMISSREGADHRGRLANSRARGFIAKADLTGDALAALLGG